MTTVEEMLRAAGKRVRGVKVARRTVTKYRRSMLLPAVDFRRA